jgi:CTP:molybdopterin cytidylyltransferase MocA
MAKVAIVGIVLAAGDGVRMGGSKALLALDGEALVAVHAARLVEAGCRRVVAVVRAEVLGTVGVVKKARLVASASSDQAGSLAVALREDRGPPDEILVVAPVDSAPAGPQTIGRLVDEVAKGSLAATPRFETKSGHPIACRRSVLDPYRGQGPYPPLRDVLRSLGAKRAQVDVNDPRVAIDLDTPEDVVAFTGHPPRFLGAAR